MGSVGTTVRGGDDFMELTNALAAYVAKVALAVRQRQQPQTSTAGLSRPAPKTLEFRAINTLRILVEDLESEPEFQNLVIESARSFSPKQTDLSYADFWTSNVADFFRNSGFYLAAYKNEIPDTAILLSNYAAAFGEKTTTVKYLVPLEFVEFDKDLIDFQTFRVIRLNRSEVAKICRSEINSVFYPYAYADLSDLSEIWFLEVTETVKAWEPGSGGPAGLRGAELEFKSTDFPSAVEYVLKHLTLLDWGTYQAPFGGTEPSKLIEQLDTGWDRFHVPFYITTHDNLLWPPNSLPDVNVLSTQPSFNENGEEIGHRPVVSIYVEGDEFRTNLERIANFLDFSASERSSQWLFLDTSLNYLCKAFFAEGLDQLLWHLVAVEALLGDKSESGLTNRLARRIGYVVANNDQERSRVKRLITKEDGLYQLRSDLVHGNSKLVNKKVYLGHLREARELARRSILWFLEMLNQYKSSQATACNESPQGISTREEILAAIDLLSNEDLNPKSVQTLMKVLQARVNAEVAATAVTPSP
jgi:hypothetical protein